MRILSIAAYTFLALSVPKIAFAIEDNANQNQDYNLKSETINNNHNQLQKKIQVKVDTDKKYFFEPNSVFLSTIHQQQYNFDNIPEIILSQTVELSQIENEVIKTDDLIIKNRQPIFTTAHQLKQAEVVINLRNRYFLQSGTARDNGLTSQPTIGITWGVTDDLELTLDAQTVDNGGPDRQGEFNAQRINPTGYGPNFFQEFTLQAKQRLWENKKGTQAISGVVAASLGNADRPFVFFYDDRSQPVSNGLNNETVISLELPFTVKNDQRWQFTVSPKVAFLPEDNALYYNTAPISNPGSFGTVLGLAGGANYQLNSRVILWGDSFIPFTGNNTINRDTGLPARNIAFNAGVRYLVNPRLATDLFISNTLGNTGALSVVTDRDHLALGFGVTFLPGITSANRRYPQHFRSNVKPLYNTNAGFGFFDGGTIAKQQLRFNLQGGSQGLLTGIRYGLLDDLEIGAFLSNIPGTVDESQLGFSGRLRFLHQAQGDPLTLSVAGTIARANNVFTNFFNNDRNRFNDSGLEKGGFAFSDETLSETEAELFIITLSTPMHYQFQNGSAVWLTPTLGFVQRSGLDLAGFNLGGSIPINKDLNAIAEVGFELTGNGNAFIGDNLETVIPWTLGLRWNPASLLNVSDDNTFSNLQLEAYLTNRLGSSPFDSLRVRADNETAVGVGLVLPVQF